MNSEKQILTDIKSNEQQHSIVQPQSQSRRELSKGDELRVGSYMLHVGHNYEEMIDSTHLLNDSAGLKLQIANEGYALIRNYIPRHKIQAARNVVIHAIHKDWNMIQVDDKHLLSDAHIKPGQKGMLLTGFRTVTHHPDVLNVLEGSELVNLFIGLFDGAKCATFDNKWVRVHGFEDFTDEHTDYYRFQGNAKNMYTCWIPLGDYDPLAGTLAVCVKSHLLKGYTADVYGTETKMELPPDFKFYQKSAVWKSTHFHPGDICIFDIRTIHASTMNTTHCYRISMDTRWQPSHDVPELSYSLFEHFNNRKDDTDKNNNTDSSNIQKIANTFQNNNIKM